MEKKNLILNKCLGIIKIKKEKGLNLSLKMQKLKNRFNLMINHRNQNV